VIGEMAMRIGLGDGGMRDAVKESDEDAARRGD